MSAVNKLRSALSALDDAKRKLKRVASDIEDDQDIRRALREIEDAEGVIQSAISEIKRAE